MLSRDRHLEDFEAGVTLEHRLSRTLLDSDSIQFTSLTLAYNPIYLDARKARAAGHPGLVVNPLLVFLTVFGLTVEDLSEGGGPFLGVDHLAYHGAVYAGETITGSSTVLAKRESESRPGWGIVTWRTNGFSNHDRLIISFERSNLIPKAGIHL
jgi:acyl dehydratase